MEIIDYNGTGRWEWEAVVERYGRYARSRGDVVRELMPQTVTQGNRKWVNPVMDRIVEGIEAGDSACVQIGIEFIEEDGKFAFGRALKARTARSLRRAVLTQEQKARVKRRVFGMLAAGHVPHEFGDYARLASRIGFGVDEVPEVVGDTYVRRFRSYFLEKAGK